MMMRGGFCRALLALAALLTTAMPVAAQVSVVPIDQLQPLDYLPVAVGLIVMLILWRVLVPQNLSSLQVAFEVGDDVYEVHRLTRNRKEARSLMGQRSVEWGIYAYLLSMAGLLILICELFINPTSYAEPIVFFVIMLVGIPIIVSPWETMNAQLARKTQADKKINPFKRFIRRFGTMIALAGVVILALITASEYPVGSDERALYASLGLLAFMGPTIMAYGRIMGASWNMLILNKFRTMRGRKNPIDPDEKGFGGRFAAFVIIIFVLTMPLAAVNGVLTVVYLEVLDQNNANAAQMYDFGGLFGWQAYKFFNAPWVDKLGAIGTALKSSSALLSVYLSFNVAIIGLAFIFEVTRVMFLGGQAFGGVGGLILATPREIRSEQTAQNKLLFFAFAGFSGYSVLLMMMTCYTEFQHFMPYTELLDQQGFTKETVDRTVWWFISAGHSIFLTTWLLSLVRLNSLRKMKFDLNPDERRDGDVSTTSGTDLEKIIADAALADDLDALTRVLNDDIEGDEATVRMQRTRARMLLCGRRGLWGEAAEAARSLLAQQGGDDDESRMIICLSHVAGRRLDAARESLRNLLQDDSNDEPEMLALIIEWFDPWNGNIDEDDLYNYENNSLIDLLMDLGNRLKRWDPLLGQQMLTHNDNVGFHANISSIAMLRIQRRHEEAMDVAIEMVRKRPDSVVARIAVALCLLDEGELFSALDIYQQLEQKAGSDPRVVALAGILGYDSHEDELESSLAVGDWKGQRRWIDKAPSNPMAALALKSGRDEALTANLWVASGDAIEAVMPPRYKPGRIKGILMYIIALVGFGTLAFGYDYLMGTGFNQQRAMFGGIGFAAFVYLRRAKVQSRQIIKHRDQGAMLAYERYLRRNKIKLTKDNIPIGTHLLISGILASINGVVYDLGYPGWLTWRLEKENPKEYRRKMNSERVAYQASKPARDRVLQKNWWKRQTRSSSEYDNVWENLLGAEGMRINNALIPRRLSRRAEGEEHRGDKTQTYRRSRSVVSGSLNSDSKKRAVRRRS
ncbi:MAG: hypothetical protein CL992_04785 [Euryarchaeota archaeon]|nr:hypothetical protein [Euryarchaeota archaeon]